MKVLKFGGTSVGSAKKMEKITGIIHARMPAFVILSAMAGTTDALAGMVGNVTNGQKEKARKTVRDLKEVYSRTITQLFGDDTKEAQFYADIIFNDISKNVEQPPSAKIEREILSCGEKLSTFLFHQLLLKKGYYAVLLDATVLLPLGANHEPVTDKIKKQLQIEFDKHPGAQIFVTQGFVCGNERGEVDNLGRGGSDYSASLFGAAMGAEEIQIWTDIDGVQNNDPRIVGNTRPVRYLMFDEAAELAYFGAKILHPLTILPAQKANIPVLLKNTMQPEEPGTRIAANHRGKGFKAVAARDEITAIKIKSSRMLMAYGFIRKVFEVFEKYETPIDMITTSEVAVSVTIDNRKYLSGIVEELQQFGKVEVENGKTIVGVVGHLIADEPGYARQLFGALGDIPIRMISYGASPHNISLLVNTKDKIRTLRALNSKLFHN